MIVSFVLLLLSAASADARAESPPEWLHVAEIGIDKDGDLISWRARASDSRFFELIEKTEKLLLFQLFIHGRDVSDEVVWHHSDVDAGLLAEVVGQHASLALEFRRRYRPGIEAGTIVHELSLSGISESPTDYVQAAVVVRPRLRQHAPNDEALGDFFYGYNRVLATSPTNQDRFETVEERHNSSEIALVTRHVAIVVSADRAEFITDPEAGARLAIRASDRQTTHRQVLGALELDRSVVAGTKYSGLLYSQMSKPMRLIARIVELTLDALGSAIGSTGGAVVVFALLLRTLLLPLGLWSIRQQRQFADIQQQMKPRLKEINKTMKGAEKSEEIFKTYKDFGISPFSGLKGSIGLFVQLPILIALFAVTTESAMFRAEPFLWISDLSLPDRAIQLPFLIPGVGHHVNFLPILLGVVCVAATIIQSRSSGPRGGSSPRSGLILALVFVVFFYPCAAALVLYWIVVNSSQILEGLYVSLSKRSLPSEKDTFSDRRGRNQ